MADSDVSLDILIRTLADVVGADRVQAALDGVKKTAKDSAEAHDEAGKAAEKHSGHLHGLHKICHALNEIVPGLGVVMQSAFTPVGAAVSVAVMALHLFREKLRETEEELNRLEEEAAKPMTHRLEAMREGVVRTAESTAELKDRLNQAARAELSMTEAMQMTLAAMRQRLALSGGLAEAMKANELAALELAHAAGLSSEEQYANQRLEIEQRYLEQKRQLEERQEATEMMVRRRAAEQAELAHPGLVAAAESAAKNREQALQDLGSIRTRSEVEEDKKKTESALREFERNHPEWSKWFEGFGVGAKPEDVSSTISKREDLSAWQASGGFKGMLGGHGLAEEYTEWAKLKTADDSALADWKKQPAEEARKKVAADAATREAENAARRAEENQKFITDTQRDVEQRKSLLDERHKANAELNTLDRDTLKLKQLEGSPLGGAAGANLNTATQTAAALQSHRQVTEESKQQLVDVATAIAGHRVSLQQAVQMMNWAARDIGNFTKDVERLANAMGAIATGHSQLQGKIESIERQVQNLLQHRATRGLPGSG
jgi:hypothetical protein